MFFVISLTPLTIIIDDYLVIICLAPGLELDLYSRVWLFRMVGPVQHGCAVQCWLKFLINYSTVLLLLNVLLNAAFANEPILCHPLVSLCTCIFAVWLVEYVICSFLQYSFIRRGVSQRRWWSGGLSLFLVDMPVEWSRHSCSVVCFSFVFRCVECYFWLRGTIHLCNNLFLRILNSYSFVLYYQYCHCVPRLIPGRGFNTHVSVWNFG